MEIKNYIQMKKRMKILVGLLLVTFAVACGQADKTFTVPVRLNAGFYVGADPNLYLTLPSGGVADWNTLLNKPTLFDGTWASLTGKPLTFAPSAHNHDALYRPIGYVPSWAEVTGKPTVFAPDLTVTNPLYKPTGWFPTWDEVTAKPATLELSIAIEQLGYLPVPQKTTTEISVLVIPTNTRALVYDRTLEVLKIWNGTLWKIFPTTN
jgi:hypothetical protein